MEINFILLAITCYLIGSIPFAYIITKLFGFGDIRNIGSGNVGSTNVLRTGNRKLAFIVLLFDILIVMTIIIGGIIIANLTII